MNINRTTYIVQYVDECIIGRHAEVRIWITYVIFTCHHAACLFFLSEYMHVYNIDCSHI